MKLWIVLGVSMALVQVIVCVSCYNAGYKTHKAAMNEVLHYNTSSMPMGHGMLQELIAEQVVKTNPVAAWATIP